MNRRQLLIGLMALAVSQVACQQNPENTLRVAALEGVLPPRLVAELKTLLDQPIQLKVRPRDMTSLFQQLQQWQRPRQRRSLNPFGGSTSSDVADWVSVSDYWLAAAIDQNLISPLAVDTIPTWNALPERWASLLQRNQQGFLSNQGQFWGTPYRWGSLVMVYARRPFEQLGWQPTQWTDLWHPDLLGRVSIPVHPRMVLGVVLKSLGYSANDPNPLRDEAVDAALQSLPPQIKVYASEDYLQPLILGDTWVAVGWSTDVRPMLSQYPQLNAVVPTPGTLLTADLWVKPRAAAADDPAIALTPPDQTWVSYWWNADIITPLSLFSQGLSPRLLDPEVLNNAIDLTGTQLLLPSAAVLASSDFLQPLPPAAVETYSTIWQALRGRK